MRIDDDMPDTRGDAFLALACAVIVLLVVGAAMLAAGML